MQYFIAYENSVNFAKAAGCDIRRTSHFSSKNIKKYNFHLEKQSGAAASASKRQTENIIFQYRQGRFRVDEQIIVIGRGFVLEFYPVDFILGTGKQGCEPTLRTLSNCLVELLREP